MQHLARLLVAGGDELVTFDHLTAAVAAFDEIQPLTMRELWRIPEALRIELCAAFESVGQFEPKLCGAADWELWLRMAHRFTWAYMAEPLAKYTRHLDNMSSNHDKMIAEFVQSLRNVLVKCDLAPPDRAFIRQQLRTHLFGHAYLAYDRGDIATARRRFWLSVRAGDRRPYTLALAGLCLLPGAVARRVRGAKQTVGGARA